MSTRNTWGKIEHHKSTVYVYTIHSKRLQLLLKYTLHTQKLSRKVDKHIRLAQTVYKGYSSYKYDRYTHKNLPLELILPCGLGWLTVHWKPGDLDCCRLVCYEVA